jgi:hypothetical protein
MGNAAEPTEATLPWRQILAWTFITGVAGRLCWAAAGLWMKDRGAGNSYRASAVWAAHDRRSQAAGIQAAAESGHDEDLDKLSV